MMTNKNELADTHPLQTPHWASFRSEWGNEVITTKYGVITLHRIPHTKYKVGMFIKGPKPTNQMLEFLVRFGKENNLIFIKLEPNIEKSDALVSLVTSHGAVPGKTLFTPTTFVLDLTKSEEELLSSFHPKTRYNIRLAVKQGVTVTEDNSDEAFNEYLRLTKETSKRQGFYAHSEKYHKLMWRHLKGSVAHLLVAKYNGEVITAWILFSWGKTLYYPYGASTDKHKNVMANNLMMWEAIKLGKKLGLISFDLWGREEGKGFTKFKEGYSPRVVEFLGTWDLVINKPLYKIYRILEVVRWKALRLISKTPFKKRF